MKINIKGEPDDLIKRCETCRYCIFEDILTPEQRKIKKLKEENPDIHMHRGVVEQLCGKYYDKVCPMKYAAQKASVDDRTGVQMAVIKDYIWDMGKQYKKEIKYAYAIKKWTEKRDMGRRDKESRAGRYDEIWTRGIRKVTIDDEAIEKQVLTADFIYEIIMTTAKEYERWLIMLDIMIEEHKKRDEI